MIFLSDNTDCPNCSGPLEDNHHLSDNTNCPNCSGPLEDNHHFLFKCPKYNNLRLVFIRFHTDNNT